MPRLRPSLPAAAITATIIIVLVFLGLMANAFWAFAHRHYARPIEVTATVRVTRTVNHVRLVPRYVTQTQVVLHTVYSTRTRVVQVPVPGHCKPHPRPQPPPSPPVPPVPSPGSS